MYVTFRELGGSPLDAGDIVRDLPNWPLDTLLGYLAALSLDLIQKGAEFFDPRHQGPFLNRAIVDDFPTRLPRASQMYLVGRVPLTGNRHLLIHEHNLAWLSNAALVHSAVSGGSAGFPNEFITRVCRLLLLTNDVLGDARSRRKLTHHSTLNERRLLALEYLRHFQFNRYVGGSVEAFTRLARQKMLYQDLLPKIAAFDVEAVFKEATNGLSVADYFEMVTLFVTHLMEGLGPGKHWLSKKTLFGEMEVHHEAAEQLVFRRWARTRQEYCDRVSEWNSVRPTSTFIPDYDYVPLRETPLIEARPDQLVCPVAPFLLAKIEDDPYYILSDHLAKIGDDPQTFHQALGRAYEQYATNVIGRLAVLDVEGKWDVVHSPRDESGNELTDSYLQRGSVAICFEHKAQRPPADFLRGGPGERVLGPNAEFLTKAQTSGPLPLREGRKNDDGLLTRGLWQLSLAGPSLMARAMRVMEMKPQTVFILISHLAPVPVDPYVRSVYLQPLMFGCGLLTEPFWAPPQWLHVSDLEALLAHAEQGKLDLEQLLRMKAERQTIQRFDMFLFDSLGSHDVPTDLKNSALQLLTSTQARFWPSSEIGPPSA